MNSGPEFPGGADTPPGYLRLGPIVGREAQLARLRTVVDTVRTQGQVLVVLGDAGMGKTVLLADAAQRARAEVLALQTGARLGLLRALVTSEIAATTDSLTGQLNRRSMEEALRRLDNEQIPYAVAFAATAASISPDRSNAVTDLAYFAIRYDTCPPPAPRSTAWTGAARSTIPASAARSAPCECTALST